MIDRLFRGVLLALSIGALAFVVRISLGRWQLNQSGPAPDNTSVSDLHTAQAPVTAARPTEAPPTREVGESVAPAAAPDFTLPTLTGEMVSLSDYLGKPVLVNFWATWCLPCRIEMPTIQRVFDKRKGALVVLGVNMEETQVVIRPFVDELGLTFPILLDSDGLVTWQYDILGLPTSIFVTPEGAIYTRFIGPMDQAFIEETLDEMSTPGKSNNTVIDPR